MKICPRFIISMMLLCAITVTAQEKSLEDLTISFKGKMPQGLVGNGQSNVTVDHYCFGADRTGRHGKPKKGHQPAVPQKLVFSSSANSFDLHAETGDAAFFPGGTIYSFSKGGTDFEVFHTALENDPHIIYVRFNAADGDIGLNTEPAYQKQKAVDGDRTLIKFSKTGKGLDYTWDELKRQVVKPYAEQGMVLECPSENISKAVAFNQYLLDLGYNGRIIVCELFRYRDIWSRDMGSGFGPAAAVSNRIKEAKDCIAYDLNRYEKATPSWLKTAADASRGGSAEGTAFLTMTLWEYYKVTGDLQFLKRCADGIRPWVEAWLDRDYNQDGLIIDVTEWMDHSRYYLLGYGSSTLFSNALMVELLTTFSDIEQELGDAKASMRYQTEAQRFANAINDKLWSPELNAYANLYQNGKQDLRTASAANALAVLAGVSSPERTQQVFESLEKTNWRPAGSMTITPLMTHNESDQNEKIWPWWNAVESRARFVNQDPEGGVRILENCAATINVDELPGLIEETLSKDGETEGGNSFPSAAGSFLVAVYKGLFGIDILSPGMKQISIKPNLPESWKSAKLRVPTAGGHFTITVKDGTTTIDVADQGIQEVAVRAGVTVNGAKAIVFEPAEKPVIDGLTALSPPEIVERNAVVFTEKGLHHHNLNIPLEQIGLKELSAINESDTSAVIFPGNAVPAYTESGDDMREVLETFVDNGGAVIFYGITMRDRGKDRYTKMGSEGGVVEWYNRVGDVWSPIDIRTGETVDAPVRGGTVYWAKGPNVDRKGPYFRSWDVRQGMFGFGANGRGVQSTTGHAELNKAKMPIKEVFSDFAVSAPWYFHSLADTKTDFNFMHPQQGETLSCFCRVVNRETQGEYILIPDSLVKKTSFETISKILKIKGSSQLVKNLEAGKEQTVVTYGTSLTKMGAWPDQLRAVLEQNYPGQVTLINSGQGGSNSAWGRKSFEKRVIQKQPDTMIIEFAINDSVAKRKVTVAMAQENLEAMIDRLLESNPDAEIILMTMNPCVGFHKARRPDLTKYYQMYRDVAKARGFKLIDHYPSWEKTLNEDPALFLSYVPDGIHPVREGALQVIMPTMIESLGLPGGKPELNERMVCWNSMFSSMDKAVKRDKQVTQAEYDQHWKKEFSNVDANKDGVLTVDEYKSEPLFNHIDANNDASVTLEELLKVYAPFFKRFDTNADGKLVAGEIWKIK